MPKKSRSNVIIVFAVVSMLLILSILIYKYNCTEGFESTPKTFEADVNGGKKLVWFYANWCGHCKSMAEGWDNACAKVNKENKTKMVKINVGENNNDQKKIVDKYKITGYPTILVLDNGKIVNTYEGERNENSFISYVNKNLVD